MPTNYNQYQVPQTITMFTVHGEEGAMAFPVAPGQKATLIDADNAIIYVKSANQFGQALPAIDEEAIRKTVDASVKAALQKYFPQINFGE